MINNLNCLCCFFFHDVEHAETLLFHHHRYWKRLLFPETLRIYQMSCFANVFVDVSHTSEYRCYQLTCLFLRLHVDDLFVVQCPPTKQGFRHQDNNNNKNKTNNEVYFRILYDFWEKIKPIVQVKLFESIITMLFFTTNLSLIQLSGQLLFQQWQQQLHILKMFTGTTATNYGNFWYSCNRDLFFNCRCYDYCKFGICCYYLKKHHQ